MNRTTKILALAALSAGALVSAPVIACVFADVRDDYRDRRYVG